MIICPSSSFCTPARIFRNEDLPAPLRPIKPIFSPLSSWKEVLSSRATWPTAKEAFSTDKIFMGKLQKRKGGHFNRLSADICRQSYEIESIRPSESSFQTAFIIILEPSSRNADRLFRLLRVRAVYAAKSPAESDKAQSHLRWYRSILQSQQPHFPNRQDRR